MGGEGKGEKEAVEHNNKVGLTCIFKKVLPCVEGSAVSLPQQDFLKALCYRELTSM